MALLRVVSVAPGGTTLRLSRWSRAEAFRQEERRSASPGEPRVDTEGASHPSAVLKMTRRRLVRRRERREKAFHGVGESGFERESRRQPFGDAGNFAGDCDQPRRVFGEAFV